MVHLFKALYFPQHFLPPPQDTSFEIIEGVLRLSNKYDVPTLRRCALQHLVIRYPTDLDKLQFSVLPAAPAEHTYDNPSGDILGEVQAIVALARETHSLWLIPSAFYDALGCPLDHIVSQWTCMNRLRTFSSMDVIAFLAGYTAPALRQDFPYDMFFSETIGCQETD
ncbi:hypothetical protein BD626DRAFT_480070 [Schizophyllum amplum]|uniref:Uncharacterized protein n=1 Tax=Schizophyllum amplum TaxID=97359 RepID=A0A550CSW7_9AGAR|nr:hypothetical protein BD626DRAFT_480070 [Auriculariopsis ampla]